MNLTNQQKGMALGAGVALIGLALLFRSKPKKKMPIVFKPGQTARLPSGASLTLQLPGGDYDLLGDDSPDAIIVLSTQRVGNVTNVTLMAPDTSVPYETTPQWVDINDPRKVFSLRIIVEPLGSS